MRPDTIMYERAVSKLGYPKTWCAVRVSTVLVVESFAKHYVNVVHRVLYGSNIKAKFAHRNFTYEKETH